MNQTVIASLLPVVVLIAIGVLVGKRGWIRDTSIKDLSNLVFLVLSPALLFHAMSTVRVEELSLKPVAAYFLAAGVIICSLAIASLTISVNLLIDNLPQKIRDRDA